MEIGCVVASEIPKLISGLNPPLPANRNAIGFLFTFGKTILLQCRHMKFCTKQSQFLFQYYLKFPITCARFHHLSLFTSSSTITTYRCVLFNQQSPPLELNISGNSKDH